MHIEWKDSYQLGDHNLNVQHRQLFELANKILATDDVATIRSLAVELYRHTRIHFEDEEALMRERQYPGLASHIESHNRLLGRLNGLSQAIGRGRVDKAALQGLMTDWAMFHIPQEDARFEAYLLPAA
ncbi:hemerythrin domain-containing protein [Rhodoferax sp. U2-2l]|uniref:bacteriohemerythrin n=1 Tax=Rhodoferax sp. U2-2l TaxID=2884000 RepID=UPI001D09FA89|nr:hemerythrin domain-containing protein [Rhodoferax sp. U2-2l]MCB8745336.1 hemerythrin domain-containing protein [Rhodoferax sp. U2-2l]